MIELAKLMPEVRFRLVWRTGPDRVEALVREAGVENVEIVAGFVPDMGAMYDSAHATILAALTHNSLKPCPHSGLRSLAHGKPVLVSHATSFAGIVKARGCGVVFEPTVESLRRDPVAHQPLRRLPGQRKVNQPRVLFEGGVRQAPLRPVYESA